MRMFASIVLSCRSEAMLGVMMAVILVVSVCVGCQQTSAPVVVAAPKPTPQLPPASFPAATVQHTTMQPTTPLPAALPPTVAAVVPAAVTPVPASANAAVPERAVAPSESAASTDVA